MKPLHTRNDVLKLSFCALASLALPPARADAASERGRSGFIPVPDGKVWYRIYGSGPKTPLLTLHGGPGAAHNYILPLRALADDRPVIFFDQLGCGLSDAPRGEGPYHIARFVTEVDAVRERSSSRCYSVRRSRRWFHGGRSRTRSGVLAWAAGRSRVGRSAGGSTLDYAARRELAIVDHASRRILHTRA
jgi:alpha/beta hydrolase fold